METAKVFISSILNPNTEDLRSEREAIRVVVESYGFLAPWAFERAPASFEDLDESYLRHVEECDLFVLIVGRHATNPVTAELQRAKDRKKPVLVFSRVAPDRAPLATALIESAGVKYASFQTIEELRQATSAAINQTLVAGLRALQDRSGNRSTLLRLKELIDKYTQVRIKPVIPAQFEQNLLLPRNVTPDVLTLDGPTLYQTVHVPLARISELLFLGQFEPPLLLLEGRLQLISASGNWRFFDEKPSPDSPFGFSKPSSIADPRPNEIKGSQQAQAFRFHWGALAEIGQRIRDGWEVVYDDDGCYFRIPDRAGDLIFMRKRS